jgi:hypothetical protein
VTTLVDDMDHLLLGWNVDAKSKSTYLDLEITAKAGTKLADQFARIKTGKTNFAGLELPNAAVAGHWIGAISDDDVAQTKNGLAALQKSAVTELQKQNVSEDEVKLATQLLGDLIDVVQKTVETKKVDNGVAVMLEPGAVTVVAGAAIADGAKLEKTIQRLTDEIQKNGQLAGLVNVSAENYQGIRLHIITGPTPDQELVSLVGDTLEVVVGTADDKVLIAAGHDAVKVIKKAIDASKTADGKDAAPMKIVVAVTPIAKFLAGTVEDEQVKAAASMVAGMLEKANGKDRVTITAEPIAQGVRLRLQPQEGLLKVLGSMSQTLAPGLIPEGSN